MRYEAQKHVIQSGFGYENCIISGDWKEGSKQSSRVVQVIKRMGTMESRKYKKEKKGRDSDHS